MGHFRFINQSNLVMGKVYDCENRLGSAVKASNVGLGEKKSNTRVENSSFLAENFDFAAEGLEFPTGKK